MTNVATKKRSSKRTETNKNGKNGKSKRTRAISTYKAALDFLFSNTNYESVKRLRYNVDTFSLDRMNRLLRGVGNPHKKLAAVHVAGSKGKGSTCTMLAEMLIHNGYKVGLYTSPHVLDLRERIVVNHQIISEAAMVRAVKKVAPMVKKMADDPPTFFEILTAIAFLHFLATNVDIAVVETGLGGRLDSTNVIVPEAVGITNISIDHQ